MLESISGISFFLRCIKHHDYTQVRYCGFIFMHSMFPICQFSHVQRMKKKMVGNGFCLSTFCLWYSYCCCSFDAVLLFTSIVFLFQCMHFRIRQSNGISSNVQIEKRRRKNKNMVALTCNVWQFIACHQFWCVAQILLMFLQNKNAFVYIRVFACLLDFCNVPDLYAHLQTHIHHVYFIYSG